MCEVRGGGRAEANTDEVVRVQEKTETKKSPAVASVARGMLISS